MITPDEVREVLPSHLKTADVVSLAGTLNTLTKDPEAARNIRENFVTYTTVLKTGRYKTDDYLNAVAYVTFKLMGFSNQESYKRAFPKRHQSLMARGATEKEISSYVASYNKNKLVNAILEQTLVPLWILNRDAVQMAIATQVELMQGANSEKVRSDAANSILTHLKQPETSKVELAVSLPENEGLNALTDMLTAMAKRQQELIAQGVETRTIAHQKLGGDLIEAKAIT